MSAPGYCMITCKTFPLLGIGDAQIVFADKAAASLYGYDDPTELAGRYLSDLQPPGARHAGRTRYALRQMGHDVADDYCTQILRPDGEIAGCHGSVVSSCYDANGAASYLTALEGVRTVEEPTTPELAKYEASPEDLVPHTGRFTVQQIRDKLIAKNMDELPYGETFTTIVSECEWLSTHVFNEDHGRGLDLALSNKVSYSVYAKNTETMVYLDTKCPRCGRKWWRRHARQLNWQCPAPSCKAHLS